MDQLNLNETFHKYETFLFQFCNMIKHSSARCLTPVSNNDDRYLENALKDYWHQQHGDGRYTSTYPGVVQLEENLIEHAERLNDLKLSLQKQFAEIGNGRQKNGIVRELAQSRHPDLNRQLHSAGLARLHLKQLTRTLLISRQPLTHVNYSWYVSGRSIRKLNRDQAIEKLNKSGIKPPSFEIYYRKLAALNSTDCVAQVQHQAPLLRVNLVDSDGNRFARNCSLPVVVSKEHSFPEVRFTDQISPVRTRKKRSDNKIDDHPLIAPLRLYLYK